MNISFSKLWHKPKFDYSKPKQLPTTLHLHLDYWTSISKKSFEHLSFYSKSKNLENFNNMEINQNCKQQEAVTALSSALFCWLCWWNFAISLNYREFADLWLLRQILHNFHTNEAKQVEQQSFCVVNRMRMKIYWKKFSQTLIIKPLLKCNLGGCQGLLYLSSILHKKNRQSPKSYGNCEISSSFY